MPSDPTSPKKERDPPISNGPLHMLYPYVEPISCIPKDPLHHITHNLHTTSTHNFSVVKYLEQSPMNMSTRVVLQKYPT